MLTQSPFTTTLCSHIWQLNFIKIKSTNLWGDDINFYMFYNMETGIKSTIRRNKLKDWKNQLKLILKKVFLNTQELDQL